MPARAFECLHAPSPAGRMTPTGGFRAASCDGDAPQRTLGGPRGHGSPASFKVSENAARRASERFLAGESRTVRAGQPGARGVRQRVTHHRRAYSRRLMAFKYAFEEASMMSVEAARPCSTFPLKESFTATSPRASLPEVTDWIM